jgi:hypothetical protein
MLEDTLKQLETWYKEPSEGTIRPKLLSKMAVIEICGWIEGKFDEIILDTEKVCLKDEPWCRENIVNKNFGFNYNEHFRSMLVKLMGEATVRLIEADMETQHPGEIESLKSILGMLWKRRCSYAHADIAANVATQQTFDAPSWAINQHRRVSKIVVKLEGLIASRAAAL